MKEFLVEYIGEKESTFKAMINEYHNILDNIQTINFEFIDFELDIPQLMNGYKIKGFKFNLSEISNNELEIIFAYKKMNITPTGGEISFYDEDKNRLVLTILEKSEDETINESLLNEFQTKFTGLDIFAHEFTHYLDWTAGTIESFEPKTREEYFNHKSEINAYINQGLFILLNDMDGIPTKLKGIKYSYMYLEFMSNLNDENLKLVETKLNEYEKGLINILIID